MSEFAEQNFPLPNQAEGIDELTVEEPEGHVKVAERPHPLTPLVDGWLFVVAVIVFFGQDFFQEFVSGRLRMSDIRQLTLADKGFWIPFAIALGILVLAVLISLASWWFTRFVVDDDEVRIERTFINHQSQRIAFSKIQSVDIKQPLVARIFGLASLSIDVGADSSKKIQYLKRDRAYKMRDFLMARANRVQASTRGFDAPPPQGPASPSDGVARSGIFEDVLGSDQIVVKVPIQRLIGSIVMSMGTIWSIMFIVFFVALGLLLPGEAAFAGLVGLLPVVFGYFGWIMKELKEGFNYTLTWTSSGLKTTHGLTELISRSVPVHRIQGVQISQPLPWRIFGWKRVRIDVLGHGVDSEDATGGILLLPVGNDDEVRRVLEVAVPQLGARKHRAASGWQESPMDSLVRRPNLQVGLQRQGHRGYRPYLQPQSRYRAACARPRGAAQPGHPAPGARPGRRARRKHFRSCRPGSQAAGRRGRPTVSPERAEPNAGCTQQHA